MLVALASAPSLLTSDAPSVADALALMRLRRLAILSAASHLHGRAPSAMSCVARAVKSVAWPDLLLVALARLIAALAAAPFEASPSFPSPSALSPLTMR